MANEYKLSYTATEIDERLGMVDSMVKSVNGVMPDESGNVKITITDSGENAGHGGLTTAQIIALDELFCIGVYTADASGKYAAFRQAFGLNGSGDSGEDSGDDTHSHSYASSVTKAATCETVGVRTYTCSCGHSYTEAIVATGHNYVDGTCTVCGAKDPDYIEPSNPTEPVYQLTEALTFDGETTVNTGYNLFDKDKDWTICLDAKITNGAGYALSAKAGNSEHNPAIGFRRSWDKYVPSCYGFANNDTGFAHNADDFKVVLTRVAGSAQNKFMTMHFLKDGAVTSYNCTANAEFTPIADSSLILGGCIKADGVVFDYMSGTINDFSVYERVLSSDDINNYLGANK